MNRTEKLFAFRLAVKEAAKEEKKDTKWKAREGVSIAGCTLAGPWGDYRTRRQFAENGIFC